MILYITPLNQDEKARFNTLTLHELSILMQVAKGDLSALIAETNFVTLSTVQRHIYAIRTKLDVQTNVAAVLIYQRARVDLDLSQILPKATSRLFTELRKYSPNSGEHLVSINAKMLCKKSKVTLSNLPKCLDFLMNYNVLQWEKQADHRISIILNKSYLPLSIYPMPDWETFKREHLEKEAA